MENYINHLHAENVGIFEKLDITFNKRFNFVVGPNSSGKTSILKCIALSLAPGDVKEFRYGEESEVWFEALCNNQCYRVGFGKGWISNVDAYREVSFKGWYSPPDKQGVKSKTVSNLEDEGINITPLILGAYRRIEYKKIEGMHREKTVKEQRKKYHTLGFRNIVGGALPDIKQWMINRYFQTEKEWATLYKKNWEWIIQNLSIVGPKNCHLEFVCIKRELEPIFKLRGVECYLEEMSAGFQAVLSLIFAIVEWIESTNEEENAYIPDATGTVIIDELDVHLHPEWQLTIRQSLANIFPKLQFIITTHSPHLIATAEEGELIVLPELQRVINIEPTQKTYSGWSTDQILEEVMGVKSLENKKYSNLLKQAMEYIEKRDVVALNQVIDKLQQMAHPSNTILHVLQVKRAQLELGDEND